jgi:TonB-linked SusC/RagA family outer membrane protein
VRSRVFSAPFAALLVAAVVAPALAGAQQTRVLTGTVTSTAGVPLPDISVTVAGSTLGARTNERGQYRLTAPATEVVLVVRGIGYQRTTIRVAAGQTVANAELTKDVLELEQVVVTGQSTTTEKRNATTATATVSSQEVARAPAPSIEGALQGKVIGASINMNNGAPGGGGQIQIRGPGSILGQSDPLFVVDGVIVSNGSYSNGLNAVTRSGAATSVTSATDNRTNRLGDINPNEIESIEVLKSAAATAIYGSRATNGVIVIRTKRGTPGATRVSVTQRLGTQDAVRLPGQRRYNSRAEALSVAGAVGSDTATIGKLIDANGLQFNDFSKQLYDNHDPQYETVVAVSGGSDRTTYRVSGSQKMEQGIALNTNARLQTLRTAVNQTWSKVTGDVTVNFVRNTLNRGISNNDNTGTSPLYIFGYTPSFINLNSKDAAGNYTTNIFNCPVCSNPFQTFALLKATEDVWRGIGSYNLSYNPVSTDRHRLVVTASGGIDRFSQEGQLYSPNYLQYEPQNGLLGTTAQRPVFAMNLNNQLAATYTYSGRGFNATLSAGGSAEEQESNQLALRGQGLAPGLTVVNQGQQDLNQVYEFFRDQAVFGNVQLNMFNERLNLLAGVRADRSSANGDPAKFYAFPRVSASYRFDAPLPFVDNVKFRAGYGQTGNRPVYSARAILLSTGSILDGRSTLSRGANVGNPGIRPETLNEQEYGVDASALNSRLSFEGTYFDRNITNLLLQPTTAFSTGFTSLYINAGELNTRGYEFGLTVVPVQTRQVTWSSRATYQSLVQEVRKLPATVPPFAAPNSYGASYGRNRIQPGARSTAIWGNAPVRTDASGKALEIMPVGTWITSPNLQGLTQRDTIIGDANPDFQMFFSNSLTYRRLTLTALVDWRKGGDVADMTNNLYDEGQQSRDYADPGPAGSNMTLGEWRYNAWAAGRDARVYVQDGGFVKLREVSLAYDLPSQFYSRINRRISSARLSVQARNLAVWTDYWGAEPESSNFGNQNFNRFIDLATFPTPRQFFIALDFGF